MAVELHEMMRQSITDLEDVEDSPDEEDLEDVELKPRSRAGRRDPSGQPIPADATERPSVEKPNAKKSDVSVMTFVQCCSGSCIGLFCVILPLTY